VAVITEQDCIDYIQNLVINRSYDGYTTEITTIYGQLEKFLDVNISPAPDEWDRLYNVDFFIEIGGKFIGLQIKPVSEVSHIPQIFKERGIQVETHLRFTKEFGGRVFYVMSVTAEKVKKIANIEVVDEIRIEMERLKKL